MGIPAFQISPPSAAKPTQQDTLGTDSYGKAGVRVLPDQTTGDPITDAVSVNGDKAYQIVASDDGSRGELIIINNGTGPIELGGHELQYGHGIPLAAGQAISITQNQSAWYGISAAIGTIQDIRFCVLKRTR